MYKPADMSLWKGRTDNEVDNPERAHAARWYQRVTPWQQTAPQPSSVALLGFACDEGVSRNQGRIGAKQGPQAIRQTLANLVYPLSQPCIDAGDVVCDDSSLEVAQRELAQCVRKLLTTAHFPVVLGGGHEIAWGSFQGIVDYLNSDDLPPLHQQTRRNRVGIINLDAHFDLRAPTPDPSIPGKANGSSGTPFRQIAEWCETHRWEFNYCVLGINASANSAALFDYARGKHVLWYEDWQCESHSLSQIERQLDDFIGRLDYLYFTVCLDGFAAASAPGVSAPSIAGIDPLFGIALIKTVKSLCSKRGTRWLLADIAELNPSLDRDQLTARLAARLIYEICLPQKNSGEAR